MRDFLLPLVLILAVVAGVWIYFQATATRVGPLRATDSPAHDRVRVDLARKSRRRIQAPRPRAGVDAVRGEEHAVAALKQKATIASSVNNLDSFLKQRLQRAHKITQTSKIRTRIPTKLNRRYSGNRNQEWSVLRICLADKMSFGRGADKQCQPAYLRCRSGTFV